jgi:two-component system, chemotaxis family, protein-glutamate methylesterase/glutaminase
MQSSLISQPPRQALFPRAAFDLVAIAASTGGVSALRGLIAALPASLPTPVAIVQHVSPFRPSRLVEILGSHAPLKVKFAEATDRLRAGTVFIAPPDRHLVIRRHGRFGLENGSKVAFFRPSADRLFTSAAEQLGPRLLCIVLTGMGQDGAAGAAAVKAHGGFIIVQDPLSAQASGMPREALTASTVDLILPLRAIPSALISLCEVFGTRELFCGRQSAA